MKLIVDITRANVGSEAGLVQAVHQAFPAVPPADMIVFAYPHQRTWGDNLAAHEAVPTGSDYRDVAARVRVQVMQLLPTLQGPGQLVVLTFHRAVFEIANELTPAQRELVSFRPFSSLPGRGTLLPSPWPMALIPLPEAMSVLTRALAKQGADDQSRGIRQTDLRFLLSQEDRRFDKVNPGAAQPGFISGLVRAAVRAGQVCMAESEQPNPRIWLAGAHQPTPVAPGSTQVLVQPPKPARVSRSQVFFEVLRTEGLGPFSRVRAELYDALERAVNESPVSVAELLKKTIDTVRAAQLSGEVREPELPWRVVRGFLTKLLSTARVLIDGSGQEFSVSFANLRQQVHGLAPQWRLRLEGELVMALIRSGVGITLIDVPPLAGALFLHRTEETESRTAEIVDFLLQEGRVCEAGDPHHTLAIK